MNGIAYPRSYRQYRDWQPRPARVVKKSKQSRRNTPDDNAHQTGSSLNDDNLPADCGLDLNLDSDDQLGQDDVEHGMSTSGEKEPSTPYRRTSPRRNVLGTPLTVGVFATPRSNGGTSPLWQHSTLSQLGSPYSLMD